MYSVHACNNEVHVEVVLVVRVYTGFQVGGWGVGGGGGCSYLINGTNHVKVKKSTSIPIS